MLILRDRPTEAMDMERKIADRRTCSDGQRQAAHRLSARPDGQCTGACRLRAKQSVESECM